MINTSTMVVMVNLRVDSVSTQFVVVLGNFRGC